ncbi:MAG TPA: DinB family protein [Puia sp.]|nr:DinB family protein [Puia sp.]
MALFSRTTLITDLLDRTELLRANTQAFGRLTDDQLRSSPGPGKWSIQEIYGHLNLCLDQYIRLILPRIALAPDSPSDIYRSGWFGDRLYKRTMPGPDGQVLKSRSRTAWQAAPGVTDPWEVLGAFQRHCDALDDILRHAATKDLRRIRVPFFPPNLAPLRLGDLLRYLVAHGERHLLQAQRVMILFYDHGSQIAQ